MKNIDYKKFGINIIRAIIILILGLGIEFVLLEGFSLIALVNFSFLTRFINEYIILAVQNLIYIAIMIFIFLKVMRSKLRVEVKAALLIMPLQILFIIIRFGGVVIVGIPSIFIENPVLEIVTNILFWSVDLAGIIYAVYFIYKKNFSWVYIVSAIVAFITSYAYGPMN